AEQDGARKVAVSVIAPAANVPYVRGAPEILCARGVLALPDFICNAGAVLGYVSTTITTHREMLELVAKRITDLTKTAIAHPRGAFAGGCAGGCARGEGFVGRWRQPPGLPAGPPLA